MNNYITHIMKKYILTPLGKEEAYKLKISKLYLEANVSNATLYLARRTGEFSHKTLLKFFQKYISNFAKDLHYKDASEADHKNNVIIK